MAVDPEWKTEEPFKRGTCSSDHFDTEHLPRIGETLSLLQPEGDLVLPGKVANIETRMGFKRITREGLTRVVANSLVTVWLEPYIADQGQAERLRETLGRMGLKNWQEA
jgi:hypothetical protein